MVETQERPLSVDEQQTLAGRLAEARRESRMALIKTGAASALVCGVLAVMTLVASDAPWWIITLFWMTLAVLFTVWIGMPWRRLMRHQVASFDDALRTNRARVVRVQSTRVVEFEEEEDEGACYAFEHAPGTWLLIVGQEFYEDDDFPNTDFSMIDILGRSGVAITSLLTKTGRKLLPARVIPATTKRTLNIPEHMTELRAAVDEIEIVLAKMN